MSNMNNSSQETLRRVTENDPSLIGLRLADNNNTIYGNFYSDNSDDYSTLGAAITNNTQLDRLAVTLSDDLPLGVTNREFYDGLQRNTSISNLSLRCNAQIIAGGVGQEILKAYQENSNHLIDLEISDANLQSGGDRVIVDTLRSCRYLQKFTLYDCNIIDEQLLPIVDALRGHRMLETVHLDSNNIGNAGCEALATLLKDSNCNLRVLDLDNNTIDNEGATTIANSLTNNNKMTDLYLVGNQIDQQSVQDVFSNILCNTTSINDIYSSNHTLETLSLVYRHQGQQLQSLLRLNENTNKNHVAMRKILNFHPNIDMEPLFQWDSEGEQSLKALPYVIDWFERAKVAVADDDEEYGNDIEERKLSAIFQFARAMPLLFGGISYISADNKKRKRED